MKKVPIGISRGRLETVKYDFTQYLTTNIASNKLININCFMDSLLDILKLIPNTSIIFIDTQQLLPSAGEKQINYVNDNFNEYFDKLNEFQEKQKTESTGRIIYIFYGIERLKTKLDPVSKLENLLKAIQGTENTNIIFCDSTKAFKSIDFDSWYSKIKNTTDGIWVGTGLPEQSTFRIPKLKKEMSNKYPNNYAYCFVDGDPELIKLIEFNDMLEKDEEEEEEGEEENE